MTFRTLSVGVSALTTQNSAEARVMHEKSEQIVPHYLGLFANASPIRVAPLRYFGVLDQCCLTLKGALANGMG
jgi:hypothetical protein